MSLPQELKTYLETHHSTAQQRLLAWFSTQARDLPWRHHRSPYRIWVAEIMLQQTQVETVRDYYTRFMARFPTVYTLAKANLEDVLKLWEGLGYYSRARSLHRAARMIVNQHGGQLPADVKALRHLPGIGPYTAGAVASIAFGIPAPAVDGNVRRVMARLLAMASPTAAELEEAVGAILSPTSPGAFNEALMELGATLCRPTSPRCLLCPWQTWCRACALGEPERFPVAKRRKPIPHYDVVAAVTRNPEGQILVARRRQEDMLGGLWEFPGGKRKSGETLEQALQRELREEMDIDIAVDEQLTIVKHAYTHFRITLYAFACRLIAGAPKCLECDDFHWATFEDIRALPMAVTDRKIAQVVEDLYKS